MCMPAIYVTGKRVDAERLFGGRWGLLFSVRLRLRFSYSRCGSACDSARAFGRVEASRYPTFPRAYPSAHAVRLGNAPGLNSSAPPPQDANTARLGGPGLTALGSRG